MDAHGRMEMFPFFVASHCQSKVRAHASQEDSHGVSGLEVQMAFARQGTGLNEMLRNDSSSTSLGEASSDEIPGLIMQVVRCEQKRHAEAILAIFNHAIVTSTALYDYKPRTMETMSTWFDAKAKGKFPVLGLENEAGELMGFASYGTFRAFPAYKYSVEHSVYVDARFRGQGLGKRLLEEIVKAAQEQDYHLLIGVIDAANTVSIRLHERLGFVHAGTIRQAGFKFGRWLDVALYQRLLTTPAQPGDG